MSWFPRPSSPFAAFADSAPSCASGAASGDRRLACAAGDGHHRHRIRGRFEDGHGAAAAGRLGRALSVEPHRRRDHRRPEEGPGGAARRRKKSGNGNSRNSRNSSACERRPPLHGRSDRARRGCARPHRSQPQCRLRDRLAGGEAVGRGATAPGGRPHAEAVALEQAGARPEGATLYVTLEPCAHDSERGPACADL